MAEACAPQNGITPDFASYMPNRKYGRPISFGAEMKIAWLKDGRITEAR